ncbi:MAG: hypothetical protein PSV22_12080 [Pseudolabrys sp.]|nr:hypothetical protein [Pseudolabrys sp.]
MRFVLLFPVLMLAACNGAAQKQKKLVAEAQAAVSAQLLDPTSPLFTQVTANATSVCGLVNGKNRLGAYVGAKRFVYSGGQATIEPNDQTSPNDRSSMQATGMCLFNVDFQLCKGGADQPSINSCYDWLDKDKAKPSS